MIGCIQFAPALGDQGKTMESLSKLIPRAKDAELLVLPELCNSGYHFIDFEQAWKTSEPIYDSVFINFLISACQKYGLNIVSGFNERYGTALYNSAILVGPKGIVGKYQKLHLFNTEKEYFKPGQAGLPVFDIKDYRIGIQICFDWMFPEAWRVLALKGADIICHPSNLVMPGLAQQAVPTHALINRVFTITGNRIGEERNLKFTGNSLIANPRGKVIARASDNDQEILLVEIDPKESRDKWINQRNNLLADRKPEEYIELVK